jgi:hypothetical protein
MRSILAAFQLSLLFSAFGSAHPSDLSPFILALEGEEKVYANNDTSPQSPTESSSLDLFKRQNCAANYYFCSTVVSTAVCCSTDTFCSQDAAGNAACCPIGALCTGKIPLPSAAPATTTSADLLTTTDSAGAPIIITTTNTQAITTVAVTAFTTAFETSYVSNPYDFPFPYIATTFPNSASCAAAYSSCAAEYDICTNDLQGGAGYGVTISAPGGGTTVAGTTAGTSLGAAAAATVCGSLSAVACPGIAGGCVVFGTKGGAATTTGFVAGSGADRGIRGLDSILWVGVVLAVITGAVGWVL